MAQERTVEAKKDTPPRKFNFPVATAIAILTGITSLLVFLTGKTNLPDILKGDTPTFTPSATPTFTVMALPLRTATATAIPAVPHSPTARYSPTATDIPWVNGMGVHPPSDGELKAMPSIWSLVRYRELTSPGSADYTATIAYGSAWKWDWSFCTTKSNFFAFIDSVDIRFLLDDEELREGDHLRVEDGSGQTGWLCRRWWAMLSGWPRGRAVRLDIRWTYLTEVDDGVTVYPAGQYNQLFIVIAE
jgi:hypothetical protein